jgi:hypothetical protein
MFSSGCVYAELVTHVLMSERILKREGRFEPASPKPTLHYSFVRTRLTQTCIALQFRWCITCLARQHVDVARSK